jgi:hypothetical protein
MILSERNAKKNLERTVRSDCQVANHGVRSDFSPRHSTRSYPELLF